MTKIAFFDKFQDMKLITSFWISFIGIYAFLRILRLWGNFAPPLLQIGSFTTPVQIGLKCLRLGRYFRGKYSRGSRQKHVYVSCINNSVILKLHQERCSFLFHFCTIIRQFYRSKSFMWNFCKKCLCNISVWF